MSVDVRLQRDVVRALRALRDHEWVSTDGGSALASEDIARTIERLDALAPIGQEWRVDEPHWAFAAAEALRPFAAELVDVGGSSATDRGHILWMIDRMNPKSMSATKACRWLGWIQCALCDQGVMNLPAAKEHNLKFSTAAPTKGNDHG